jgi:uncharacterized repeat protein (TIGR03803 family)
MLRLVFALPLMLAALAPIAAQAKGFQIEYAFTGGSAGSFAAGGPVVGPEGELYGMTQRGGSGCTTKGRFAGCGVAYRLAADGVYTVLHQFNGTDGQQPTGELVRDAAGNLYGVTSFGGRARMCPIFGGCGVAFKLAPDGTFTLLHAFQGGLDPAYPFGGMIADAAGNLYGATSEGCFHRNVRGYGCIYKIAPDGTLSVLHRFQNGADGSDPSGPLVLDPAGNLYGVTDIDNTANRGNVFKIAPDGTFTVLHDFTGAPGDVGGPSSGIIRDAAGTIYGVSDDGGAFNAGAVFSLAADGTERVLHSFAGGSDGRYPESGLTIDGAGNLYGVTTEGGSSGCAGRGCGIVYRISPDGKERILHVFHAVHGKLPVAKLAFDAQGNLQGTVTLGGGNGFGMVFKIAP